MIDYLIVGSGLAGIAFTETALQNGKSVLVFDDSSQQASRVAAGLYNPVILKRFSKLQDAQQQLDMLHVFFSAIEAKIQTKVNHPLPILRKFFSVEEQNNWFAASDKPGLSPFLSTKLVTSKYSGIDSPYGYGEVLQSGYVDTALLLDAYQDYLAQNGCLAQQSFDYNALQIEATHVVYNNTMARHVIFAEGFGIQNNPFFNHLPLSGTKGELLVVKADGLELDVVVKGNVFVLPVKDQLFKIGATYNWDDKTNNITDAGKQELIEKANEILNCGYEITGQLAGIRPTVKDRKPLLGTHKQYHNLHVLNGLGTRGVMLAPCAAKKLFDHIEYGKPIEPEYDKARFE